MNDDEVMQWLTDEERKHFEEWKRVLRLGFGDTGPELDITRKLAELRRVHEQAHYACRVALSAITLAQPEGQPPRIIGADVYDVLRAAERATPFAGPRGRTPSR